MQENPNAIPEGETPHNVTLMCYDPLIDVTKPGDRITVTGAIPSIPNDTLISSASEMLSQPTDMLALLCHPFRAASYLLQKEVILNHFKTH